MKKLIGLATIIAVSGCGNKMDVETKQNCLQIHDLLGQYRKHILADPNGIRSEFDTIYTRWMDIRESIPDSRLKMRVDNSIVLHQLILRNMDLLSLIVVFPEGTDLNNLPDDLNLEIKRNEEARIKIEKDCSHLHQMIGERYLQELHRIAKNSDVSDDVLNLLHELISNPMAMSYRDPQTIGSIARINLNVGTQALNKWVE